MKELTSCKEANELCMEQEYFALAHLYRDEKIQTMHIHSNYELYYSISGAHRFLINEKSYDIEPGNVFVINNFETHHLTKIESDNHERIIFGIHPDYLSKISSPETDLTYCFTHRPKKFSHRLILDSGQQKRFLFHVNKIKSANGFGHEIIERCAFTEMMLMLTKICMEMHEGTSPASTKFQFNSKVDSIITYINQHIDSQLSIEMIASHFYLSESYLCRLFKQNTGVTINNYITTRRISIAKKLLSEGHNVNEVYSLCGFNDYSNFFKAFTKSVGISPKKYSQNCIQ